MKKEDIVFEVRWQQQGSWQNNCDGCVETRMRGKADQIHKVEGTYFVVLTTTTCRQLGNDTTYDTEKKNPTSHDVADTTAVSGRRFGKT